jgi:hypothetical protein
MEVRNVSNPVAARAGQTEEALVEKEFNRFEKQFGLALAIAGLAYYADQRYNIFSKDGSSAGSDLPPVDPPDETLLRLR